MKYGYINITKGNSTCGFFLEGAYYNGEEWCNLHFIGYNGYSVREGLRAFRAEYGLKGKHNITINDYRRA